MIAQIYAGQQMCGEDQSDARCRWTPTWEQEDKPQGLRCNFDSSCCACVLFAESMWVPTARTLLIPGNNSTSYSPRYIGQSDVPGDACRKHQDMTPRTAASLHPKYAGPTHHQSQRVGRRASSFRRGKLHAGCWQGDFVDSCMKSMLCHRRSGTASSAPSTPCRAAYDVARGWGLGLGR
jgi:hypothetical protein